MYMAGHYIETMSADPGALASGDRNNLYKDEDIKKEFGKFIHASYNNMSDGNITEENSNYIIDTGGRMCLNRILAHVSIVTKGGVKGADVTLNYVVQPYTAIFFEHRNNINGFQLKMTRSFRIIGG